MAEITKTEWQELRDALKQLSDKAIGADHKLDTLKSTVDELRSFRQDAERSISFVTTVKAILGVMGAVVLGAVCTGIWRFAAMSTTVEQHASSINEMKQTVKEVQQRIDRLLPRVVTGSVIQEGEIVKVSETELVLDMPNQERRTFKLTPDTTISVDGQPVKPSVLKAGLKVQVVSDKGGKAAVVNVPVEFDPETGGRHGTNATGTIGGLNRRP